MSVKQAVILCGGVGSRLRPYTDHLPKPMIPVNGRPFLAYLIDQLREQGIERVVLLTGYLGHQIETYFGDGRKFGLMIEYSRGEVEWETGRRIWEARHRLDPLFLLLYGDNFVPFNLAASESCHVVHGRALTLLLVAKANGNIRVDAEGHVLRYDSTRSDIALDHVEIGYMLVEREAVLSQITDPDVSFSTILQKLVDQSEVAGRVSGDRYHSISDPARWSLAENYLRLKRIVLIDRDGTINRRPPRASYVSTWDEVRWQDGAIEGVTVLAQAGFSFVLISNQAGIARGMITRGAVDAVNTRLAEELAARNVSLLKAYVCPHHWGERCACRKPAPGLFFQASRDFELRLDRTVYIGDDPRDCQAAYNANVQCVYVGDASELESLTPSERPAFFAPTIAEAAPWIVSRFEAWEYSESQG